jgi:predicted amidohydrolase
MSDTLKITLIQTALHWEDVDANIKLFSQKIAFVKEATDLILLPEMFSTGFTMNAAALAEEMNGPAMQWMKKTAAEKKCVITGSLIISEGNKFYNRLIWMRADGSYEYYNKRHMFRLAHEEQTYSPGDKKIYTEIKGWQILPLVCYDLRFPVWSRRTKQDDYDLLIYVANWPEKRNHAWKQLLIARAIENQCYVAGLNRVGNDGNDFYHTGDSTVTDFKGEHISNIKPKEEGIETVTLHKPPMNDFRKTHAFIEDADPFKII